MPSFKRTDRLSESIQRKLSELIMYEVKDPRLPKFVTISGVEVSPDLSHAKVYFTVFNEDTVKVAEVLNATAGFLRSALARTMTSRTVPQLHFYYDPSLEYGNRLSSVINKLNVPDDEPNEPEQD